MGSHKVTLAELRKLAQEAFPGVSRGVNYDKKLPSGVWYSEAVSKDADVRGYGHSRMAARRQLREQLQLIVDGREMRGLRESYRGASETALKTARKLREDKETYG